ncbi:hypothetical protein B0T21DRAFT_350769 [Apiosordaria backusii]|uniref:Uncharacterized protein n=1 Tax=Apiosordaria backusii TaxID=314023 RepID=A0AA40B2X6_9PEZI|nr:hypothetical protein B0T21DRAFT_350769 [Apiosordaria backusii]
MDKRVIEYEDNKAEGIMHKSSQQWQPRNLRHLFLDLRQMRGRRGLSAANKQSDRSQVVPSASTIPDGRSGPVTLEWAPPVPSSPVAPPLFPVFGLWHLPQPHAVLVSVLSLAASVCVAVLPFTSGSGACVARIGVGQQTAPRGDFRRGAAVEFAVTHMSCKRPLVAVLILDHQGLFEMFTTTLMTQIVGMAG